MSGANPEVVEEIVSTVRQCARTYRSATKRKAQAASTTEDQPISKQLKGSLAKCLPQMMYGFGDVKEPSAETIDCVETLVLERVASLASKCVEYHTLAVGTHGKVKLNAEDLLFEIRKDKRKHGRCKELLRLNEEIKQAKKQYEKPEMLEDGK
mmetsp:Transcript_31523/g.68106  ORF Transcript_31523/g.68106 Transcript_31523/m.68106 type:complete len:153 (+) Transcript_31523:158-616(+)